MYKCEVWALFNVLITFKYIDTTIGQKKSFFPLLCRHQKATKKESKLKHGLVFVENLNKKYPDMSEKSFKKQNKNLFSFQWNVQKIEPFTSKWFQEIRQKVKIRFFFLFSFPKSRSRIFFLIKSFLSGKR